MITLESGRVWVEQLQNQKQIDATLANKPLLMVASAQAGPLLQPYVLSGQITGMISGISDAAKYETKNSLPAGIDPLLLGYVWDWLDDVYCFDHCWQPLEFVYRDLCPSRGCETGINQCPLKSSRHSLVLLLTLMVFSYLIGDNPLFRIAVYLFIGVSSGYAATVM